MLPLVWGSAGRLAIGVRETGSGLGEDAFEDQDDDEDVDSSH